MNEKEYSDNNVNNKFNNLYLKPVLITVFIGFLIILAYFSFSRSLPIGYRGESMPTKIIKNLHDNSQEQYFLENKDLILNSLTNPNFKLVVDSIDIYSLLESYAIKSDKGIIDFENIKLESTTKKELHSKLEQNNAQKKEFNSTNLVYIFKFNNGTLTHLNQAATYWNKQSQWVGLYLTLGASITQHDRLRHQLLLKYGKPSLIYYNRRYTTKNTESLFLEKNFFGKAFWYKNNVVVEFSSLPAKGLETDKPINKITQTEYLRYIHIERATKLNNILHHTNS